VAAGATSPVGVTDLTVEHRGDDPLGIDAERPRLGWQMDSRVRGQLQTAYQVLVATGPDRLDEASADMWNSGKVESSDSVAVRYDGAPLEPSTDYYWSVRVWDKDGRPSSWSDPASFETSLMSTDGATNWGGAEWISMAGKDPRSKGAPMLREQVALEKDEVERARLYISALGVYDAYLNGERVGVVQGGDTAYELLAPGWTNYDSVVNYMSYDVTSLVGDENQVTLGAVLGNGWYDSRISERSTYYSTDGNQLALKAKLLVEFEDGTSQVVVTKPGDDWQATDTGPYRADGIYDGQTTDGRHQLTGWSDNGYDDGSWSGVIRNDFTEEFPDSTLVAYPGETAKLTPRWNRDPESITVYTGVTGEESSPNGKGHIVVDEQRSVADPRRAAGAATTLTKGDTAVYNLGQNVVGVPRYTVEGPPGTKVQFRFGEMLNDDSEGADGPEGSVYRANLRSAKATSTYILSGEGRETHQDSLSFYGFQYVEARVLTPGAEVTIHDVAGAVATSAVRDIGHIETDSELVNQLYSNVRWGQRGNYLWVPTDCPQRDERLGWTGDTQLFANTALYNADSVNFLAHWQDSLIDSQGTYGIDGAQYTSVAPGGKLAIPAPVSGWADAGVVVPWTVWQMSGDSTVIDQSWASMTKYMDWIYEQTGDTYAGQGSWTGDWLAFQPTANQLASDVYYAYSASLMADMADAIGRPGEANHYSELFGKIKAAFIEKYLAVDPESGEAFIRGIGTASDIDGERPAEDNTQTALLWALKLGLFENQGQHDDLLEALVANVRNTAEYKAAHPDSARVEYAENTLSVGFLGVNVLAPVLTAEGHSELAYQLLHQDAMPSWLYSVKNGATTVWERWNSYSEENGFGPVNMNSFNHYAYGAIAEWMYEDMVGIAKDPESPGFKHFFLQPKFDPTGKITKVEGSYESPYGQITSEWKVTGKRYRYKVTVPPNSTATLRLAHPAPPGLERRPGVELLETKDGATSYRLESGSYTVTGVH
jgi:alpha-L-rhamnosidase